MVRTCGPKEVGSGCLRDRGSLNKAYCYCNDGNLCNNMPNKSMSDVTTYSRNDGTYPESSTSDDSDNNNYSDNAATQKHVLSIIFIYTILLYIIPIYTFL